MPGENTNDQTKTEEQANTQTTVTPPSDIQAQIDAAVKAAIADLKVKLDTAYGKRDEVQRQLDEYKRKENEAEIAKLKEQGNLKEAHEREMAEVRSEIEKLRLQNTSLTRDTLVKSSLTAVEFRNARAAALAEKQISDELIRDGEGNWVHKSGKTVAAFVSEFLDDADNAFLLKPKVNNGGGGSTNNTTTTSSNKSLFEMSQAEVMKMAAEGKLRNRK